MRDNSVNYVEKIMIKYEMILENILKNVFKVVWW